MASLIRLAIDDDAPAMAELYRPIVESTAISFETQPPDEQEMRRRLRETLPSYPWLVYETGGTVAGYAYATKFRVRAAYQWSVETSVYVHADYRRLGIGRGLYTSLVAILSAQGFFNAYAGITLPNPASVALHESVGFAPVGVYRRAGYKLGAWHDVGWWQVAVREETPMPQTPRLLPAAETLPQWDMLVATGMSMIRTTVK